MPCCKLNLSLPVDLIDPWSAWMPVAVECVHGRRNESSRWGVGGDVPVRQVRPSFLGVFFFFWCGSLKSPAAVQVRRQLLYHSRQVALSRHFRELRGTTGQRSGATCPCGIRRHGTCKALAVISAEILNCGCQSRTELVSLYGKLFKLSHSRIGRFLWRAWFIELKVGERFMSN
jgi:hypothetical protein